MNNAGDIDWYRMDSFTGEDEVVSSAYEYVASYPGTGFVGSILPIVFFFQKICL